MKSFYCNVGMLVFLSTVGKAELYLMVDAEVDDMGSDNDNSMDNNEAVSALETDRVIMDMGVGGGHQHFDADAIGADAAISTGNEAQQSNAVIAEADAAADSGSEQQQQYTTTSSIIVLNHNPPLLKLPQLRPALLLHHLLANFLPLLLQHLLLLRNHLPVHYKQ